MRLSGVPQSSWRPSPRQCRQPLVPRSDSAGRGWRGTDQWLAHARLSGRAPETGDWWHSGDLGLFDDEGFLYLNGRKKHQFVGEALPSNRALLWPHKPDCSDAELAAAVARANPTYAQVHRWPRLEQPFTPANGLLTANGRPRREAIVERYRQWLTSSDHCGEFPS